jgi:hypothetical protein
MNSALNADLRGGELFLRLRLQKNDFVKLTSSAIG